jgi:hypothetical protein
LGEDVCGSGIGLEEADAVFLVEEEVEVALRVGLDGVELGVLRGWVGGGVEAGEEKLLRACGLGGELASGAGEGHEAADDGGKTLGRERILHGLLAAGGALVQPDLNYPCMMKRLWWKRLRKTLRRYYSFLFWDAV